jgi:hypothetical protein
VAGSTTLDGESNWGVGDWVVFNNNTWQKVDGGSTGNLTTAIISASLTLSYGTASTALALDASKNVVSLANTGTGDNVLANSPTLVTPALGTPTSGDLANCTFPTLNQNTTGTAANVTGIVAVVNGGTGTDTPALVAGTNVSITGSWPNQTINSTAAGGDVVGPASATDNALARFDTTTGELIQNSVAILDDSGNLTGIANLTVNDNTILGSSNSDTVTVTARVNSDIDPSTDNTYDLGRNSHAWRNLYLTGTANIAALTASGALTLSGGTANGVAYLNGSKVLTTGSALTFDGTNLGIGTSSPSRLLTLGGTSTPVAAFVSTSTTGTCSLAFGDPDDDNAGRVNYDNATNSMLLFTNGSERARIDSSGNLLVGTTSLIGSGKVSISYTSASNQGIALNEVSGTSGAIAIRFYSASTQVGTITTTTSSTAYNTSSDYRLKNTIAPMTNALAKVALLKPCTYKWNADGSDGEGFIAHELAEVVPQCVTGEKDAVDAEGKPVYQGIDTSFLVATLTAAIQELKAEFDAYKASHP